MKKYFSFFHYLILTCSFTTLLVMSSCMEELQDVKNLDVTGAPLIRVPLINFESTFLNFFKDEDLNGAIIESEGLLNWKRNEVLFSQDFADLVTLPDEPTSPESIIRVGPIPAGTESDPIGGAELFPIDFPDQIEIDSVVIESGELVFRLTADLPEEIEIKMNLSVPGINNGVENGAEAFEKKITFTGVTKDSIIREDLSGFVIDFVEGTARSNTLRTIGTATAENKDEDPASVSIPGNFRYTVILKNVKYRVIYGGFQLSTILQNKDNINLGLFNELTPTMGAFLEFEKPSLVLRIENSFGIPVSIDFQGTKANKKDGTVIAELSTTSTEGLIYPIAVPEPDQLGEKALTEITWDNSNSNLGEILSSFPDQIEYNYKTSGNELLKGFIVEQSKIEAKIDIILPFRFRAQGLVIIKRQEFNITDFKDISEGTIEIKAVNQIPYNVAIQVYFEDANQNNIDSLFLDGKREIVKAAPVDNNGMRVGEVLNSALAKISKKKMERIKKSVYISVEFILSTYDDASRIVQVAPDDKLKLSIGCLARVNYALK